MGESQRVRDIMASSLTTLPRESSLLDAAITMRRSSVRHLPVVDGEKLVGIITERDVQRCAPSLLSPITQEEYNATFENTPIERVMFRSPVTVTPDTTVRDAVLLMLDRKVGCLPVVEGERLVGILTRSDLLNLLMSSLPAPAAPSA
ncbi:MAG: CBS domain-containing protein [Acidobacteria bacterium]|nr:CBS domain-containing protein [Acidobacteriota bacterium]MCL5289205.1 CBS domain-containing protein [Acidobacteriota bacterium]